MTTSLATSPRSTTEWRSHFAHVPTPLAFVGSIDGAHPYGMLVGSFVALSLDPPLVGFCPQRTSTTWPRLREATTLGVSVLAEPHAGLVRQLGGPSPRRLTDVDWFAEGHGIFLRNAAVHFAATFIDELAVGDHTLAVLSCHDSETATDVSPLVFHRSQLATPNPRNDS